MDITCVMLDVTGLGPNAAIKLLKNQLPTDVASRQLWRKQAQIAAIIGSCPKSRKNFDSGSVGSIGSVGSVISKICKPS